MEEPNLCVPQPSPYPSAELSKDTWSLDLTPERPSRAKSHFRTRNNKKTASDSNYVRDDPRVSPPSHLSHPHLNSTSHLYQKLHTLTQQRHRHKSSPTTNDTNKQGFTHHHTSLELGAEDLADLEGVITHKPLKEVNVPRHSSRYSDLVPVDISEQSFQELTTKPRSRNVKRGDHKQRCKTTSASEDEPSLMECFTPDLETEEATWEWNTDRTSLEDTAVLESLEPPSDAPFTLYTVVQT